MAFFHSNFMLQSSHENDPSTSLAPCANHQFQGVDTQFWKRSSMSMSFPGGAELCEDMNHKNNGEDELSDDGSQLGEKKRRLNLEQVKTLEKNFELGTKLEPERKLRLARDLGLQPRQVAIWFQNRRARWKTKQLEKDYDILNRQLMAAKAENDALQAHNQRLHAEILALKNRETINLNKETQGSSSNRSENSSDMKLEICRNPDIDSSAAAAAALWPGLFPSSVVRHNAIEQIKMDQTIKEESSFCNMLCGVDDQTGFWPWVEQHNFS